MHAAAWVPSTWVYNEKTIIFLDCSFALIQSNIHEVWARQFSSTLQKNMQYTPSNCFETFSSPLRLESLDSIGERYHAHRQNLMSARREGLTATYNRLHRPTETAEDIRHLRALQTEMDNAVASAYQWTALDLGHDFHETKRGVRFTISEAARREVLDRLLALNHARHAEEEASAPPAKPKRAGKKKSAGQNTLF